MSSSGEILMKMVRALLDGSVPFGQFEAEYRECYFGKVADELESTDEIGLYGDIIERLDWTDRNPPERDRQDGWIDHDQFREWLAKHITGKG